MNYLLQDYLRLVIPYLADVLVSPQQLTSIQQVAQLLPPLSPTLLECRLAADQPQVDLSVGIQPMKIAIAESLLSYPFWQEIRQFCQEWTTVNSLPQEAVEDIWLEFDLDGETDGLTVGCWFFSLRGEVFKDKSSEALSKFFQLISWLQNCPIEQQRQALVLQCVNALPDGVGISQIGAMRSRSGEPLRINVSGLSAQMIPAYLAQIQGEPVKADLAEMITLIQPLSDRIVLCFDIAEQIGSRIGLECYLDQQPKKEPRWTEFLNLLVAMECCTPQKRDALLKWPGLIQKKDHPELWPVNLQDLDSWISQGSISVFWRTINHLKLVYQPGRPLEVKAYIAFGHRWFKPD
ncbi:hypothetical protein Nos7524_0723 [Nostoc sp. PCC 7524]|uniref:hypothetical protein n=1 Tax=Nostoc sp. (strain ATCC 29411 / PCC 7524) TaxID=28072 RepID=UPI00029F1C94|nr:hypothetical protein [Nostoc sp. PCC 7524]AFY46629.1 hypothetical protein Nos7524_0723 [Nostoc sp. PCC 7524]